MAEDHIAILMLKVLVKLDASPDPAQQARQLRLTHFERLAPQIPAVELQQIEGKQGHGPVGTPIAQPVERRQAAPAAQPGFLRTE
jgi:hypothetical protein